VVGDADQVGDIYKATQSGYHATRALLSNKGGA